MDNGVTLLGQAIKAQTLRKVVIWFGVICVLLCSIVGSGILSMQEGARPLGTRQPPASTGVAIVPSLTPTAVPASTATPTFAPTWTPSPTPTGKATHTAAPTSTVAATSTAAATAPATPTPAPTAVLLPPTPDCVIPAGWRSYIVQPGDTLTGLAWRTGITVAAIVQANCLRSTTIYAGRTLYLPTPPAQPTPVPTRCVPNPPPGWVIYVVQAGDTLFGLAIRHGIYMTRIQQVNCLPGTGLFAGQRIYLPYIPPTATMQVPPTLVPTVTLFPTWTATAPPPTLTPSLTPVPTPTLTLVPTTTPATTPTIVVPTSTVVPSVTAAPTGTATLIPSPTIEPTQTSEPTPIPTETAQVPTETPTQAPPTATVTPPQSTATPVPTATPLPTTTPIPTATRQLIGITPPPPTVPPAATPTSTTGG